MEVDPEVIVVLFVVENRIRVNTPFIEAVDVAWLLADKTSIHCESTDKFLVFQVDQPKVQIAANFLATFACLLVIDEDLHDVLFICFVSLWKLVDRVLLVLDFSLWIIGPNHFEILSIHDLDDWLDQVACAFGNGVDLDQLESLHAWALDLSLVSHLEVLHVPLLAGLRNTTASEEPLPAIIRDGLHEVLCQARVDQKARD